MYRIKTQIGKEKHRRVNAAQRRAVKRLMRDWIDVQANPVAMVSAAPVSEKNIFTWHANIAGPKDTPWEGAILHLVMNFPKSYPDNPPTIQLCTRIEHPNVFGSNICLDMLQQDGNIEDYQGWSSAYTVKTILLQLQAFLFESDVSKALENIADPGQYEKKKQEWFSSVKWSVEQSRRYQDKSVGHFPPRKPFPPLPTEEAIAGVAKKSHHQEALEELVCFHSKQTFEEDCLGLGISFTKNLRNGEISQISAQYDLLSLRAFMNQGLRVSATNHSFTHFLPVYINEEHAKKALHLSDRALSIISHASHKKFKPEQAMMVYPQLMNTCVVETMSGKKYSSLKSLRAYCFFHRMLLSYCQRFPDLVKNSNEFVDKFIADGKFRHKDNCPNIGTFLATLSVTNKSWEDVRDAYLDEFFTRNVFWVLNKYPELEVEDHEEFTDQDRLDYTFKATKTSQKLLLFNLLFLKSTQKSIDAMTSSYDENYGRPPAKLEEEYIALTKSLDEMDSFQDFFGHLGLKKTDEEIVKILKDAIKKSSAKGYHGTKSNVLTPEEYAKQNKLFDIDSMKGKDGNLVSDEQKWKSMIAVRWGIDELPEYLTSLENPWRKLYLQYNIQDLVSKLNDVPDFKTFHNTLDVSQEITYLELMMFNPSNIKSRYFYLQAILSKLKNLNTLIIKKGSEGLGAKGFKSLVKGLTNNPGNLENLILEYCGVSPESILELTKGQKIGSNLRVLKLSGNPLGDTGAVYLAKFLRHHQNLPFLEELDVSDCRIRESGARALAEAVLVKRKLKKVNVFKNPMSRGLDDLLKNLSYNPSVQSVKAGDTNGIFASSGTNLGKLLNLSISMKELSLWKVNLYALGSDVMQKIAENESLEKLDLGQSNFNSFNSLGYALAQNKTLKELNLHQINLNTTSIRNLRSALICRAKKLKIEPEISLEKLIATQNNLVSGLSRKDFPEFGEVIKLCHSLKHLDLSNTNCGHREMLAKFGEALKPEHKVPLETLIMRQTNLNKSNIKNFMESLAENKSIKKLDLSGNALGVVGAGYVAEMLKKNTCIEELNIFGDFIEIEGADLIGKALLENKTLKKLDMGLNRIRVRGALGLVKILPKLTNLEEIGLKHNRINDKTALAIADAAISSPKISFVSLAGNFLTNEIRAEIAARFGSSKRPMEFDLADLVRKKLPDLMQRSVYMTPLPYNANEIMIKKLFYNNKCGTIANVTLKKHKEKLSAKKALYAFVEFQDPESVDLAVKLVHQKKNLCCGQIVRICRVGTNSSETGGKKSNSSTTARSRR